MRKIILCLMFCTILAGCGKYENAEVSVEEIAKAVAESENVDITGAKKITSARDSAEYGISTEEIEDGVIIAFPNNGETDRIVVIKAKNHDGLENAERGLKNRVNTLMQAYKYNQRERDKLDKHFLKTRGMYVMLTIGSNAKEAEKVFDKLIN